MLIPSKSVTPLLMSLVRPKIIGCIIDSTVTMEDQVNSVTKGCYERIHEIGRIRHNLTKDAAATLINSQVTSKLDSFNTVLNRPFYPFTETNYKRFKIVLLVYLPVQRNMTT